MEEKESTIFDIESRSKEMGITEDQYINLLARWLTVPDYPLKEPEDDDSETSIYDH